MELPTYDGLPTAVDHRHRKESTALEGHRTKRNAVSGHAPSILIGDSGGNQDGLQKVAARLNESSHRGRLHYIPEYYDFAAVAKWLEEQGITQTPEGLHDDFGMTAMMMSVDPNSVRTKQRIAAGKFQINGVDLAPAAKTIDWGKRIINFRAEATVKAIATALVN